MGKMAELLMNSAIPGEGSMRTSWPALRNVLLCEPRRMLALTISAVFMAFAISGFALALSGALHLAGLEYKL